MKKTLVLCGALLALSAPLAMAQDYGNLDLAWNACPAVAGSAPTTSFACNDPAGIHLLYGRFNVNTALTNIVAMDFALEVSVDAQSLPSFWQMEPGDCNYGSIVLSGVKPATACGTATNPTATWTDSPIVGWGWLDSGHGFPPPGPHNARFLGSVVRPSTGINLAVGVNYHGFGLTILEDQSDLIPAPGTGPCGGCAAPTIWVWNSARLTQASSPSGGGSEAALFVLEGPGTFGNVATTNCNLDPAFCGVDRAHTKTWGQIKALYR